MFERQSQTVLSLTRSEAFFSDARQLTLPYSPFSSALIAPGELGRKTLAWHRSDSNETISDPKQTELGKMLGLGSAALFSTKGGKDAQLILILRAQILPPTDMNSKRKQL